MHALAAFYPSSTIAPTRSSAFAPAFAPALAAALAAAALAATIPSSAKPSDETPGGQWGRRLLEGSKQPMRVLPLSGRTILGYRCTILRPI